MRRSGHSRERWPSSCERRCPFLTDRAAGTRKIAKVAALGLLSRIEPSGGASDPLCLMIRRRP